MEHSRSIELFEHLPGRGGIGVSNIELICGKLGEDSRDRSSGRVPRAERRAEVTVHL